ncbi:MAG: hypothetical protein M1812_001318 [Candelaria pacifica]|nr:MAG: hypothetical protein M1812_001318 [Candelaria pacifica]
MSFPPQTSHAAPIKNIKFNGFATTMAQATMPEGHIPTSSHAALIKNIKFNGFTTTMTQATMPERHTPTSNASTTHLQALIIALVASLCLLTLLNTLMIFRIMTRLSVITKKPTKVETSAIAVQTDEESCAPTASLDTTGKDEDEDKKNKSPTELFLDFADGLFELTPSEGVETPLESRFEDFERGELDNDFDLAPLSPLFDRENSFGIPSLQRGPRHVPVFEHVDIAKYEGIENDYIVSDIAEQADAASEAEVKDAVEEQVAGRPNLLSIPEPSDWRCHGYCASPPPSKFELIVTPPTPTIIDSPRPSAFELVVTPPPGTEAHLPTPACKFLLTPPTPMTTHFAALEAPVCEPLDRLPVPFPPDSESSRFEADSEFGDLGNATSNLSAALDAFFLTGEELMTREDFERFERILAGIDDDQSCEESFAESDDESTLDEIEERSRALLATVNDSGLDLRRSSESQVSPFEEDRAPWAEVEEELVQDSFVKWAPTLFTIVECLSVPDSPLTIECPSILDWDCDVIEDQPDVTEYTQRESEEFDPIYSHPFFDPLYEDDECPLSNNDGVDYDSIEWAYRQGSDPRHPTNWRRDCNQQPNTGSKALIRKAHFENKHKATCARRFFAILPFGSLDDLPPIIAPSRIVLKQLGDDVVPDNWYDEMVDGGAPLSDAPKETLREKNLARQFWKEEVSAFTDMEAVEELSKSKCEVILDNEVANQNEQAALEAVTAPLTTAKLERLLKPDDEFKQSPAFTSSEIDLGFVSLPTSPSYSGYEYRYFSDRDITSSPTQMSNSSTSSGETFEDDSHYAKDAQVLFDQMCDTGSSEEECNTATKSPHSGHFNELEDTWLSLRLREIERLRKSIDSSPIFTYPVSKHAQQTSQRERLPKSIESSPIVTYPISKQAQKTGQRFEEARQELLRGNLGRAESLLGLEHVPLSPTPNNSAAESSDSSLEESDSSNEPDSDAPADEWFIWARRQAGMSWEKVIAGLERRASETNMPCMTSSSSDSGSDDSECEMSDLEAVPTNSKASYSSDDEGIFVFEADSDEHSFKSYDSTSSHSSTSNTSNVGTDSEASLEDIYSSSYSRSYISSSSPSSPHSSASNPPNIEISTSDYIYLDSNFEELAWESSSTSSSSGKSLTNPSPPLPTKKPPKRPLSTPSTPSTSSSHKPKKIPRLQEDLGKEIHFFDPILQEQEDIVDEEKKGIVGEEKKGIVGEDCVFFEPRLKEGNRDWFEVFWNENWPCPTTPT